MKEHLLSEIKKKLIHFDVNELVEVLLKMYEIQRYTIEQSLKDKN